MIDKPLGRGADKPRLLVCNCERTMDLDGEKLAKALGRDGKLVVHHQLCRAEIDSFEKALQGDEPLLVACTQEAPLFSELAEDQDGPPVAFTNIRERAGWCDAKADALPKIAALLTEAQYRSVPTGLTALASDGTCLVYGKGQQALDAAMQLAGRLSVTLLLADPSDATPPNVAHVPIYKGRINRASGVLGGFEIVVDDYAPAIPSSRAELEFVMARDGVRSECDLVLDLSGEAPLFADHPRRDGYYKVEPGHPAALAEAMFEMTDMVGQFEKPIYVTYDADICAHGRNGKVGCSKCLDNCPTGAIQPDGDAVVIDMGICGGCGNCSAVCPTGAVSYAYPARTDLIGRGRVLLGAYASAGGKDPVLLIHDEHQGAELIAALARFSSGLPVNVLPLALYSVMQLGHDALATMLTAGACHVVVLAPPNHPEELPALEGEVALTNSILAELGFAGARCQVLTERDPDIVKEALDALQPVTALVPSTFAISGAKREVARAALAKIHAAAPEPKELILLPDGAPYGRIRIDVAGCTLCLACVGCCPANALADDPERPRVSFTEAACVQCGLCRTMCPENVITLEPRYDFTPAALTPAVLNEEAPFECVRCGKPFGVRSTIERVVAQLQGKHSMFQNADQVQLIKMCDECRIVATSEAGGDPMALGTPPRVRTTEDYLEAEAKARATGKKPEDFLD